MNKKWKLTHDNFTLWDRLKIAGFILNKRNFWTRSKQTELLETEMKRFFVWNPAGHRNQKPIFVSSGSAANTLVAMYWKDKFYTPQKNKIIFPVTTWSTAVAPFIREGFEPIFVDIRKEDYFADFDEIYKALGEEQGAVCGVFLTTLLGFTPPRKEIDLLKKGCAQYKCQIAFDHCESTLSFSERCSSVFNWGLSTTSSYFSHFLQSVEGGFVFPETREQRDYFLSLMNHGMTRFCDLPERNLDVDSRFDFWTLGNNFRNSDIHAYIGRLSLQKQKNNRAELYAFFKNGFNVRFLDAKYIPSLQVCKRDTPFALPLVFKTLEYRDVFKSLLEKERIETRPIISGNLLRHTAFSKYNTDKEYPVASTLHDRGLYVGLHSKVTEKDIKRLINILK